MAGARMIAAVKLECRFLPRVPNGLVEPREAVAYITIADAAEPWAAARERLGRAVVLEVRRLAPDGWCRVPRDLRAAAEAAVYERDVLRLA
ncbi:MAG: hypothetical protein WD673_01710 [Alphaproteobacteria bacterium]